VDGPRRVATVTLAIGVLVAVAMMVLDLATVPQSGQLGPPIGQQPPLTLGSSVDAVSWSEHWYNFSVAEASPSLTLGRLSFDLRDPNGSTLSPPPGSGVEILAPNWTVEAKFSLGGAGTYEPGYDGDTGLTTANVVSLSYVGSDPLTLQGDALFVGTSPGACSTEIT
jgi:hypothetical protein